MSVVVDEVTRAVLDSFDAELDSDMAFIRNSEERVLEPDLISEAIKLDGQIRRMQEELSTDLPELFPVSEAEIRARIEALNARLRVYEERATNSTQK